MLLLKGNFGLQGKPLIRSLPWYGMIYGSVIIPHKGALSQSAAGAAILCLMEYGHLMLFELPDLHPNPISLPLQELPDLTQCQLAESASDSSASSHAVTMDLLRVHTVTGFAVQPTLSVPNPVITTRSWISRCCHDHVDCSSKQF